MICNRVGMRMAFITTGAESKYLALMAVRKNKLFNEKVFIDGQNLVKAQDDHSYVSTSKNFLKIRYKSKKRIATTNLINFYANAWKLLITTKILYLINNEGVDVKNTFFKHLGHYVTFPYLEDYGLHLPMFYKI